MGGVAIAQDPDEAEVPAMPLNAMRRGEVDYVLPVEEIPRVITGLLRKGRPARTQPSNKESLRDGMDETLEDTLWSALRAIEESIELRTRMKTRATDRRLTGFSATLDQDISDLEQRAAALRHLLLGTQDHAKPRAEKPRKRQAHG